MNVLLARLPLQAEDYMLPCFSKQILGVDCPGCGLQRSVALLFQGDFIAAFQMYPAIYTIIPLLGLLLADTFFKIRYINKWVIALMILSVGLILGNYILKFI
ncbi:DUF2752 domain-containing protein [Ulvibacterium sp.]|uniref:DUF2752 domain-containing protein n=1 Tax=Ulvibacterium sp. TaxID=2665914 RepID=UPI0026218C97|nr:DUF2752 domain-containing protein [Ulvibacterium sp.]